VPVLQEEFALVGDGSSSGPMQQDATTFVWYASGRSACQVDWSSVFSCLTDCFVGLDGKVEAAASP
jgi:hypothetical protein